MAEPNKLTIELVDTGGTGGRPQAPPDSSAPSSVPAQSGREFAEDVLAVARDYAKNAPAPAAEAVRGASAADTAMKTYTKADVAVIEMNLLAADYAKRVKEKLLTYDEALGELTKAVRARGTSLTEVLRSGGKIGLGQTAAEYYGGAMRDEVKAAGMPVPANPTAPLKASDLRPVAMPKPNRPIADVVETKEDRERREKATEEQRSKLLLSGIAAQNILSGGGAGQKAAGAVQLAGTGMLGKGAAALAGGPAGAAIQVAGIAIDLVDGFIKSAGEFHRQNIRTAGAMAGDIAKNDGMGAFTKGVDAAADVLGKIPIAGTAAAEALKTFTTVMNVARETVNAFAERGRELSAYNGPIAQAAALADVKKIQMDIAEANRFSAQYVKLIEAQSRIDAAWRRASDPIRARIMEFLANKVAPWLEHIGGRVEKLAKIADVMGSIVDNVDKLGNLDFKGFADAVVKKAVDIEKELKKQKDNPESGSQAVESWLASLNGMQLGPVNAPAGRDRNLKLPLLSRIGG